MNLVKLSVKYAGSCEPDRSSSIMVKPPAVPMPGTDGGENAKAWASGNLPNSWFNRVLMASESFGPPRPAGRPV